MSKQNILTILIVIFVVLLGVLYVENSRKKIALISNMNYQNQVIDDEVSESSYSDQNIEVFEDNHVSNQNTEIITYLSEELILNKEGWNVVEYDNTGLIKGQKKGVYKIYELNPNFEESAIDRISLKANLYTCADLENPNNVPSYKCFDALFTGQSVNVTTTSQDSRTINYFYELKNS